MNWYLIPLGALVLLAAVVLIRAFRFRPKDEERAAPCPVEVDGDRAVRHLAAMVQCRTVSYYDRSRQDMAEFDRFRALLPRLYPAVHRVCTFERVGESGLLFTWRGRGSAEPTVLMAHYDVVPVNEAGWSKPAFDGIIEDGVLWGRGTLDTKGTLCGVLEAAETLLEAGFRPENDIYMAFAGDEEISGPSADAIVSLLKERGVTPQLVVDEGGAVVEGVFPGVTQPCALVGIGEKGPLNVQFRVTSGGGHASSPPAHTSVGILSRAAVAVENHPFRFTLTPPAAKMFDTLGRRSTFVYRLIFANLWLFAPVLDRITRKSGGELNALVRTSVAFTQMQGSAAPNVLPPEASMVANLRLIGGETVESAVAGLRQRVNDSRVEITVLEGENPSPASDTDCRGWRDLKAAIEQTWPEAVVSPYLMIACSDSRHYCRISDKVMRFSAMALSGEERRLIHGNDERIPLATVKKTVEFYVRLIQKR